jgi:hypothetical protein
MVDARLAPRACMIATTNAKGSLKKEEAGEIDGTSRGAGPCLGMGSIASVSFDVGLTCDRCKAGTLLYAARMTASTAQASIRDRKRKD